MIFFLVCLGGALGSGARYALSLLLSQSMPTAVLAVNVLGSFGLGVVSSSGLTTPWRTVLGAGVLGGFTTYSAFNQVLLGLPRASSLSYAALMLLLCLAAGAGGMELGRAVG